MDRLFFKPQDQIKHCDGSYSNHQYTAPRSVEYYMDHMCRAMFVESFADLLKVVRDTATMMVTPGIEHQVDFVMDSAIGYMYSEEHRLDGVEDRTVTLYASTAARRHLGSENHVRTRAMSVTEARQHLQLAPGSTIKALATALLPLFDDNWEVVIATETTSERRRAVMVSPVAKTPDNTFEIAFVC